RESADGRRRHRPRRGSHRQRRSPTDARKADRGFTDWSGDVIANATGTRGLLDTLVAATRTSVAFRERFRPLSSLDISRQPDGAGFIHALSATAVPRIIAECKRRSPSRGILRASYDPASHARAYEAAGAAAISVLTEPTFFDGDPQHLAAEREAVSVPLLRKD